MRCRLPHVPHEHTLAGLTNTPYSMDVITDACDAIHASLQQVYRIPANVMPHGLLYGHLWAVYCAGERRGIARADNDVTALWPVPQPALATVSHTSHGTPE